MVLLTYNFKFEVSFIFYICMQKIANIVTDKKIKGISGFIDVKSPTDEIDYTRPTLIVGWKNVISIYNENKPSILNKKINDKLSWTFAREERRTDYERDINQFYKSIFDDISKRISYYYIDFTKLKISGLKKVLNFIYSPQIKYIYCHNNSFIYIYYDNKVIGISLDILDYFNVEKSKIIRIIKSNKSNVFFDNDDFLSLQLKRILGNNKVIIPYLYSLK